MGPRGAEGERSQRGAPPLELLVGIHPVREALRAGRRRLVDLRLRAGRAARRPEVAEIRERAREAGVAVRELAAEEFDRSVPKGVQTQGVLLAAGPLPAVSLTEVAGRGEPPRWLVAIDGVEDPQNLGALARVAEGAGASGLVLPERRAAPPSPAASRASAGALEWLPIAIVANLARSLMYLKDQGFWVFGGDAEHGQDVFRAPARLFEGSLVLVLGAEGRGLRPGVRKQTDALLRVPMAGRVGSLNVASAAAVLLFEWRRRARPGGGG